MKPFVNESAENYLETILMSVSYTHLDVYKRQHSPQVKSVLH